MQQTLLNIDETKTHYLVYFDVSEVIADKIDIELTQKDLLISGRGKNLNGKSPVVSLKVCSAEQSMVARYRNGILMIALPKENSKIKSIESQLELEEAGACLF